MSSKNEIKLWQTERWCIPEANVEFVAAIKDVLDVPPPGGRQTPRGVCR